MYTTSDETQELRREIARRFDDTDFLAAATAKATREADLPHKAAGDPVSAWRDGLAVIAPPEAIGDEGEIPWEKR